MRFKLFAAMLSCLVSSGLSAATDVVVSDQAGFDGLDARIHALIARGEQDIRVRFSPGTYFFRDQHLSLMGVDRPGLSISLSGIGVRLVGEGEDYVPTRTFRGLTAPFEGPFEVTDGYVDLEAGWNLDLRSAVGQVRKRPEVVDRSSGLCRVLTGDASMSARDAGESWILLTQWYRSVCYKVEKVEGGYVYFRSPRLTDNGNALTDIDADYKYAKVLPRYFLYNQKSSKTPYVRDGRIHFPDRMTLHRCRASRFLTVSGSHLKELSVSGIEFFGNGGKDCLLKFYRSSLGTLSVSDCVFEGIRGDAVVIQFTRGVRLSGNVFRHCYRGCIEIGYESDDASVTGNRFEDIGLMSDNNPCIWNVASRTRIADNTFVDFTYCAIWSGIHFSESMSDKCSSVIENNEMYQTPAFRKAPSRTMLDSGAIYLATVSQSQVIRNNYIHDIGGPADNRGIFLDDGAVNVEVYGNLVVGIANSYCIDSRRVRWVETHADTKITRVNVNNYIGENTVDGGVRFETRGGNDGCRKGTNTVLKTGYDRERVLADWRKAR